MYKRILVAVDGSEDAERVFPHAEALAQAFGSSIILLRATVSTEEVVASTSVGGDSIAATVVDATSIVDIEQRDAKLYLEGAAERFRALGLTVDCEEPEGAPANAIITRAREMGADLIAMATHGRGGLGRLLLGSETDSVVRHAPCPLLLVRVPSPNRGGRSRATEPDSRPAAAD